MATVLTLSMISNDVYSNAGSCVIGYSRIYQRSLNSTSFFGAAYLAGTTGVIAYRGSLLRDVQLVPRNVRVTYHARRDTSIANYFEWGATKTRIDYLSCLNSWPGNTNPASCEQKLHIALKYQRLDDQMKVRMRHSAIYSPSSGGGIDFGNCGVGLEGACEVEVVAPRYEEKKFLGSHGALGGSPIGEQDEAWRTKQDQVLFRFIRDSDRAAMANVWTWMSKNFDAQQLALHAGVRSSVVPA